MRNIKNIYFEEHLPTIASDQRITLTGKPENHHQSKIESNLAHQIISNASKTTTSFKLATTTTTASTRTKQLYNG